MGYKYMHTEIAAGKQQASWKSKVEQRGHVYHEL